MARRKKKGNYTVDDRKLIMMAATSSIAGSSISEKQEWLQKRGLHHNGDNLEPQGQFVDHSLDRELIQP